VIVVSGGAGFIGSNIVRGLNARGMGDVLVVDEFDNDRDPANLRGCEFAELMDKGEFRRLLEQRQLDARVQAILHQGACSDTMEQDAEYMMDNNLAYSKVLVDYAVEKGIAFVYASSAATYGNGSSFGEDPSNEAPLNLYGESKLAFDQYVRGILPAVGSTVVGFRYFNFYGPHEAHKGKMASMVYQTYRRLKETNVVKLFAGTGGYPDGGQRRGFICVDDVVDVNVDLAFGDRQKGIFNVGTGESRSFNDVANARYSAAVKFRMFRSRRNSRASIRVLPRRTYRRFAPLDTQHFSRRWKTELPVTATC
jgi:ADP-L-glycero-D-manno-heptose 6-epimerase